MGHNHFVKTYEGKQLRDTRKHGITPAQSRSPNKLTFNTPTALRLHPVHFTHISCASTTRNTGFESDSFISEWSTFNLVDFLHGCAYVDQMLYQTGRDFFDPDPWNRPPSWNAFIDKIGIEVEPIQR
jgi:hypothetical protein